MGRNMGFNMGVAVEVKRSVRDLSKFTGKTQAEINIELTRRYGDDLADEAFKELFGSEKKS